MKTDLILIHIGTIFPEYFKDCIKQCLKYDYDIHVVINKDLKFNLDSIANINLVSVEDYINQEYNDDRLMYSFLKQHAGPLGRTEQATINHTCPDRLIQFFRENYEREISYIY